MNGNVNEDVVRDVGNDGAPIERLGNQMDRGLDLYERIAIAIDRLAQPRPLVRIDRTPLPGRDPRPVLICPMSVVGLYQHHSNPGVTIIERAVDAFAEANCLEVVGTPEEVAAKLGRPVL